jgi:Mn-dependent DtxR family transcriptional regulator
MAKDTSAVLVEKLDTAIGLLKHLVVLELARQGATQQAIAKRIRASKPSVVEMLKGTKRDA